MNRENILSEIKDRERSISSLQDEVDELKEQLNDVCEMCDGDGEIIDRLRINGRTINIPYCRCSHCFGTGIKH